LRNDGETLEYKRVIERELGNSRKKRSNSNDTLKSKTLNIIDKVGSFVKEQFSSSPLIVDFDLEDPDFFNKK